MWSIEDFCANNLAWVHASPPLEPRMAELINRLGLPRVHPFCTIDVENRTEWFQFDAVPPIGPLDSCFDAESHPTWWAILFTTFRRIFPPIWAMTELWLRLFAAGIGPGGVVYLMLQWFNENKINKKQNEAQPKTKIPTMIILLCFATVASNIVLMTDTLYVLTMGNGFDVPVLGIFLSLLSLCLSMRIATRYNSSLLALYLVAMTFLAIHLVWDRETDTLIFGRDMPSHYSSKNKEIDDTSCRGLFEGDQKLFYEKHNAHVQSIVDNWEEGPRTYPTHGSAAGKEGHHAPTAWMLTGDSRTGFPFIFHTTDPNEPQYTRVFLPTIEDEEVIALDIAVPKNENLNNGVMYLVLHGLNGGSNENYVRDVARRETDLGATVVVMIARGLMDLPIQKWDLFHGARTSDAHAAASSLRRAIDKMDHPPVLVGVGYSMGAIVLNNYVATYGPECKLDAAISISGGLDLRPQEHFLRAQRLWQPMLAETLRDVFLLGKWGRRIRERLTTEQFLHLMRASHVTDIDRHAVVVYNNFKDLDDYYSAMSALGDIHPQDYDKFDTVDLSGKKISQISVPLCVVHALDDPLVTWRTVAAKSGLLYPENLVRTGKGNLMLLLTKSGGHVGWPVGTLSFLNNWEWMSNVAASFAQAVRKARVERREHKNEEDKKEEVHQHQQQRKDEEKKEQHQYQLQREEGQQHQQQQEEEEEEEETKHGAATIDDEAHEQIHKEL